LAVLAAEAEVAEVEVAEAEAIVDVVLKIGGFDEFRIVGFQKDIL